MYNHCILQLHGTGSAFHTTGGVTYTILHQYPLDYENTSRPSPFITSAEKDRMVRVLSNHFNGVVGYWRDHLNVMTSWELGKMSCWWMTSKSPPQGMFALNRSMLEDAIDFQWRNVRVESSGERVIQQQVMAHEEQQHQQHHQQGDETDPNANNTKNTTSSNTESPYCTMTEDHSQEKKEKTKEEKKDKKNNKASTSKAAHADPPPSPPILGIDLGSTHSAISLLHSSGLEHFGQNNKSDVTPSAVYIAHPKDRTMVRMNPDNNSNNNNNKINESLGRVLVGQAALQKQRRYPHNVITGVKRLIDCGIHDEIIQYRVESGEIQYKIQPHSLDETVQIVIDLHTTEKTNNSLCFGPEHLLAAVVAELVSNATQRLGERRRVDPMATTEQQRQQAVICVPATFTTQQQAVILKAARLGGVDVVELLPEPVAAALAYAYTMATQMTTSQTSKDQEEQHSVIFDLGGGTLDICVMQYHTHKKTFKLLGTSGDHRLGGESFTLALAGLIKFKFQQKQPEQNTPPLAAYHRWAKEHKHQLATDPNFSVELEDESSSCSIEVTSQDYDYKCAHLYQQCLTPLAEVLKDLSLRTTDIDTLLLVGGATPSQGLRRTFTKFFQRDDKNHNIVLSQQTSADYSVADGAAIYAAMLSASYQQQNKIPETLRTFIAEASSCNDASPRLRASQPSGQQLINIIGNTTVITQIQDAPGVFL